MAFTSWGLWPIHLQRSALALAFKTETTIMVVTSWRMKSSTKFSNFCNYASGNMIFVAAITFCHCPEEKNPLKVAASVSWLKNVVKDGMHPTTLTGWQRQGFGLFMIISMIKYIITNKRYKQPVGGIRKSTDASVFLQSAQASPFQFYVMIGFQQLNKRFKDGFELLPVELQQAFHCFAENDTNEPGTSTFHYY
jgi:hypothetical protein